MVIPQTSTSNLLLRLLSAADYALLQPHLVRATLGLRDYLYRRNEPIERNHFIESGICSIVIDEEGGEQVEVGLYGHEGVSGTAVLMGAGQSPHTSLVQAGECMSLSLPTDQLLEACGESATLRGLLLRYTQSLYVQAAFTAASNAYNTLPERLARWLLMCHDRVDADSIPTTHEFISVMLAVRRSGVTTTLHTLESAGAIRNIRGIIIIRDRGRLEEIAGESYGGAETEYRRLIAPFGKSRPSVAI